MTHTLRSSRAPQLSAAPRQEEASRDRTETRLLELDGLRGWASLSVLLYHTFWEFLGSAIPETRNIVTASLFNGSFAVGIFFVLSGEALSAPYWRQELLIAVYKQVAKRYFRLAIPVFFSCAISFLIMILDIQYSQYVYGTLQNQLWMGHFLDFPASLHSLMHYSLFDVFLPKIGDKTSIYNPFLWTMRNEMAGSAICFSAIFVAHKLSKGNKLIFLFLFAFALFFARPYLSCFVFGMLFGYVKKLFGQIISHNTSWLRYLFVPAAICACMLTAHYQIASIGHPSDDPHSAWPHALASILFIAAVQLNPSALGFFRARFSVYLGKLSFPLYLVHFQVIVTVASFLVFLLSKFNMLDAPHLLIVGGLNIIISFIAAHLFLPVETFTLVVCRRIANWVERGGALLVRT